MPRTESSGDNGVENPAPILLSEYEHPSGLKLKNRVVMAPLTRGRAGQSRVPNDLLVEYYSQRAEAGLVITEGVSFTDTAHGWSQSAGLQTDEQTQAWKKVISAVHAKDGLISAQLWHTGRASHSSYQKDGALPVAPSAIAINGDAHRADDTKGPYETPRALETSEISGIVQAYKEAAERAKEAGFDCIEVHSANGYLLDSFLQTCTNKRDDEFGGSQENRFRIVKHVVEAVIGVYPAAKVGIRLSPNGAYNDMGSPSNADDFAYYVKELNQYGLGFLHIMDGLGFGFHGKCRPFQLVDAKRVYDHPIIANVGYTRDSAENTLRVGAADMIAFGRPFLSNPDLVYRFRNNLPLNKELPFSLWYSHDATGYTDQPTVKPE